MQAIMEIINIIDAMPFYVKSMTNEFMINRKNQFTRFMLQLGLFLNRYANRL